MELSFFYFGHLIIQLTIFYSFVHCSRFALYALVIFGDYVIIYNVKVYA